MNRILIITILFISCNNSNIDEKYEKIDFFIDKSTLSEKQLIDNNFHFSYPIKLNELTKDEFNSINESIKNEKNTFLKLNLIKAYGSDSNFGILINKINDKNVLKKIEESDYYEQLKNNFKTSKINIGKFKHNNIKFTQAILNSSNIVVINIIFNINDDFYQLNYFIPNLEYKNVLKSIESSIGSIDKFIK